MKLGNHNMVRLKLSLFLLMCSICAFPSLVNAESKIATEETEILFHDAHWHLTNYIQEGPAIEDFLEIMEGKIGRAVLFGIPLQQKWDYFVSRERKPDYYLLSDARLYYYSFVDAMIAEEYRRLSPKSQKHFDPMITGFNPTDMHATDHIRRVLKTYPGVFSGIGEFTIHKEFVGPKIAGHVASLHNEALDRILALASDIGMVVLLHCDIDTVRPTPGGRPAHFDNLKALLKSHQGATIIWAHTGLGRYVRPTEDHLSLLKEMLNDAQFDHVYFDISWDEVAKYIVKSPQTTMAWAELINEYPNRFLFGTDAVAPKDREKYLKIYDAYQPLWDAINQNSSFMVRIGNYERIFDTASKNVRAWEKKNR